VKVQYEREFPPRPDIRAAADWQSMPRYGLDFYRPQLEVIAALVKALGPEALVLVTLYSPYMCAGHTVGRQVLDEDVPARTAALEAREEGGQVEQPLARGALRDVEYQPLLHAYVLQVGADGSVPQLGEEAIDQPASVVGVGERPDEVHRVRVVPERVGADGVENLANAGRRVERREDVTLEREDDPLTLGDRRRLLQAIDKLVERLGTRVAGVWEPRAAWVEAPGPDVDVVGLEPAGAAAGGTEGGQSGAPDLLRADE